jgi:preprotein translocase subunit SecE
MNAVLNNLPVGVAYAVPLVILVGGFWIAFRIVNLPSFADFLIAVEAEMNKVSWPSQTELVRCSMVVIFLMFGLTMVLFAYDNILVFLFHILGIT